MYNQAVVSVKKEQPNLKIEIISESKAIEKASELIANLFIILAGYGASKYQEVKAEREAKIREERLKKEIKLEMLIEIEERFDDVELQFLKHQPQLMVIEKRFGFRLKLEPEIPTTEEIIKKLKVKLAYKTACFQQQGVACFQQRGVSLKIYDWMKKKPETKPITYCPYF